MCLCIQWKVSAKAATSRRHNALLSPQDRGLRDIYYHISDGHARTLAGKCFPYLQQRKKERKKEKREVRPSQPRW